MADDASNYHHGDMDIHEQVSTFHFVMGLTKWGSLALAALLTLLVLWFCTGAGFLSGAIAAIVIVAIGVFVLREKKGAAH